MAEGLDPAITASLVGAGGAVLAAVVSKTSLVDRIRRGNKFLSLKGSWHATWRDIGEEIEEDYKETLVVTSQNGSRVRGHILVPNESDKRWEFEGQFTGRFLQLFYYPSDKANNKLFLDYGCYFLEMRGDGSFDGYSVGFEWDDSKIHLSKHQLKRIVDS